MQFCGSRPQKALLWLGQGFICFIVMSTHQIMTGKCNVGPLFGPGAKFFFIGVKPGPLDGVLREPGFFSFFSFMFRQPSISQVLTYFRKFREAPGTQPKTQKQVGLPNPKFSPFWREPIHKGYFEVRLGAIKMKF